MPYDAMFLALQLLQYTCESLIDCQDMQFCHLMLDQSVRDVFLGARSTGRNHLIWYLWVKSNLAALPV